MGLNSGLSYFVYIQPLANSGIIRVDKEYGQSLKFIQHKPEKCVAVCAVQLKLLPSIAQSDTETHDLRFCQK